MDASSSTRVVTPGRAGWSVEMYAEATGVSRAKLYTLPEAQQPESVKIGRRRIIIEPPAAWLLRVRRQSMVVSL